MWWWCLKLRSGGGRKVGIHSWTHIIRYDIGYGPINSARSFTMHNSTWPLNHFHFLSHLMHVPSFFFPRWLGRGHWQWNLKRNRWNARSYACIIVIYESFFNKKKISIRKSFLVLFIFHVNLANFRTYKWNTAYMQSSYIFIFQWRKNVTIVSSKYFTIKTRIVHDKNYKRGKVFPVV